MIQITIYINMTGKVRMR